MELNDIKALEAVLKAVSGLEPSDQERVLRWAAEKLGTKLHGSGAHKSAGQGPQDSGGEGLIQFESLADAIGAAGAKTDSTRALVAAAYLSKKKNQPEVTGFEINSELKNIGHGIGNITEAIDALKAKKPQWVVQTRKEGSARQARKRYKVTTAGYAQVATMLSGGASDTSE
jgi:hypothetical protein